MGSACSSRSERPLTRRCRRPVHLANGLVAQLRRSERRWRPGGTRQPDVGPGGHNRRQRGRGGLLRTCRDAHGMAHVDHSTTAARSRPIEDPPFVGRERELAIRGRVVGRTLSGHGPQAISVRGEPGVGKTRLVREFAPRSPTPRRGAVRCPDRASPSAPLGGLIRDHIGAAGFGHRIRVAGCFDVVLDTLLAEPGDREWLRRRLGPPPASVSHRWRKDPRS